MTTIATHTSLRKIVARGYRTQVTLTVIIGVLAAVTVVLYANEQSHVSRKDKAFLTIRDIARNTDSVRDGAHTYSETKESEAKVEYAEADEVVQKAITDSIRLGSENDRARIEKIALDYAAYKRKYGQPTLDLTDAGKPQTAIALIRSDAADASVGKVFDQTTALLEAKSAELEASQRHTRRVVFIGLGLIFLAGAFLIATGFGVLRRIRADAVEPLEDLVAASLGMGAGKLDTRVEACGVEETFVAGETFNQMAVALERQVKDLRELDKMKQRFVASVSHDLMSPLTSVRGYLDLLASGEAGALSDDQRRQVSMAQHGAENMREMIEDLLTTTQGRASTIALAESNVDMRSLLEDVVAAYEPIAASRAVRVALEAENRLQLRGDARRLRQVFENIVGNAVKFSFEGGEVMVRAKLSDGAISVVVTDRGVGIPPDEISSVGTRFFRGSSADEFAGSGIGLAFSKEVLRLHNASLDIQSELGSGSVFTVRFSPEATIAGEQ